MRRASSLPSEPTKRTCEQGRTRLCGIITTCLARQRGKELADNHPCRPVEQTSTDARDLAADGCFVDIADRGAAVFGGNEGDASFAAAKSERAFAGANKRDRMG